MTILQNPLSVRFALDFQVRQKVKILTDGQRKERARVEIFGAIDETVLAHGFEAHHNVADIQKYDIHIVEAVTSQVGENIEFLFTQGGTTRYDAKVNIALGVRLAACNRTEQIDSLNIGIFFEYLWQQTQVWKNRFHALDFTSDGATFRSAIYKRFSVFFQSSTRATLTGEWV